MSSSRKVFGSVWGPVLGLVMVATGALALTSLGSVSVQAATKKPAKVPARAKATTKSPAKPTPKSTAKSTATSTGKTGAKTATSAPNGVSPSNFGTPEGLAKLLTAMVPSSVSPSVFPGEMVSTQPAIAVPSTWKVIGSTIGDGFATMYLDPPESSVEAAVVALKTQMEASGWRTPNLPPEPQTVAPTGTVRTPVFCVGDIQLSAQIVKRFDPANAPVTATLRLDPTGGDGSPCFVPGPSGSSGSSGSSSTSGSAGSKPILRGAAAPFKPIETDAVVLNNVPKLVVPEFPQLATVPPLSTNASGLGALVSKNSVSRRFVIERTESPGELLSQFGTQITAPGWQSSATGAEGSGGAVSGIWRKVVSEVELQALISVVQTLGGDRKREVTVIVSRAEPAIADPSLAKAPPVFSRPTGTTASAATLGELAKRIAGAGDGSTVSLSAETLQSFPATPALTLPSNWKVLGSFTNAIALQSSSTALYQPSGSTTGRSGISLAEVRRLFTQSLLLGGWIPRSDTSRTGFVRAPTSGFSELSRAFCAPGGVTIDVAAQSFDGKISVRVDRRTVAGLPCVKLPDIGGSQLPRLELPASVQLVTEPQYGGSLQREVISSTSSPTDLESWFAAQLKAAGWELSARSGSGASGVPTAVTSSWRTIGEFGDPLQAVLTVSNGSGGPDRRDLILSVNVTFPK
jgi:hypothetical protein